MSQYEPNYAIAPWETLEEVLEDRGCSLESFSDTASISYDVLLEIKSAEREIGEEIAGKLELALDIPKSFWLNLERNYRATLKRLASQQIE